MNEADAAAHESAHPILVPREIVNADSVFVVGWAVADGTFVEAGAALCEIETSKAIETVAAEHDGYVRQTAETGAEVPVGGVLGYLMSRPDLAAPPAGPTAGPSPSTDAPSMPAPPAGDQAVQFSAKARQKIGELGLDPAMFAGRAFVREQDVVEYAKDHANDADKDHAGAASPADPRGPALVESFSPIQRRLARVMEQSVAAIPASYLERMIDLAPVSARARALGQESKTVVTEVDLLVDAIAKACVAFPHFNAWLAPDYQLHVFQQVNVGVAVDVDGDLYVVVVKNAAEKTAAAIARELRGLQYLAQRRRLGAEHLGGGTITVTSMLGSGVQRFAPIPYPRQAVIVGLADPAPGETRTALALVFDHRIANGTGAAAFLAAIASGLCRREDAAAATSSH